MGAGDMDWIWFFAMVGGFERCPWELSGVVDAGSQTGFLTKFVGIGLT